MTISATALRKIHDLYELEHEMTRLVRGNLNDPEKKKKAKKQAKQFSVLLKQVDPDYMGGEEVYASYLKLDKQVKEKLKKV